MKQLNIVILLTTTTRNPEKFWLWRWPCVFVHNSGGMQGMNSTAHYNIPTQMNNESVYTCIRINMDIEDFLANNVDQNNHALNTLTPHRFVRTILRVSAWLHGIKPKVNKFAGYQDILFPDFHHHHHYHETPCFCHNFLIEPLESPKPLLLLSLCYVCSSWCSVSR